MRRPLHAGDRQRGHQPRGIGLRSLANVTIGSGVTSIGPDAFGGEAWNYYGNYSYAYGNCCTSLTAITIPDNVTSIGERALSGSGLVNATIGNGVTSIGEGAFANCASLANVSLGTGLTSIGNGAFYLCGSLSRVVIPDDVTSIGYRAFSDCASLTSVTLGENVVRLSEYAFANCAVLKVINVNVWLSSVEAYAFDNCPVLSDVYFAGAEEDRDYISVKSGNSSFLSATWHYSEAAPYFVVAYDANGGEGAPESQSKARGVALTLSGTIPARSGYLFRSWNSVLNGTGTAYAPGAVYNVDMDITLYAQWISESAILNLPASTTAIEGEAFTGVAAEAVRIPQGVTDIASNAFDGDIVIIAAVGSASAQWALDNGYDLIIE